METATVDLLKNVTRYLYRYGGLCIYIVGNVGNVFSILLFAKKSWRKNVCVFYFQIILFLSSIYLNSTILVTTLGQGFSISHLSSSFLLCKTFFYVIMVTSMLLPSVLILASIDRLLISSQNVDTRLYSSKRLAFFSTGMSSLVWLIFNVHILIKVNVQELAPSRSICYYELTGWYLDFVTYFLMIINCLFCVLMIGLSAASLKNVRHIRLIPRHKRKEFRSMTKKDFQLLRCLFVQNMAYVSVSITASVFSIYKVSVKDQRKTVQQDAIANFLENIFNFVYYTFYSMNFFIFLVVSKAFRLQVTAVIHQILAQDLPPAAEEEHVERDHLDLNIVSNHVQTIDISEKK